MKKKNEKRQISRALTARVLLPVLLLTAILTLAVPEKVYAIYSTLDVYTVKVETGYLALRTGKAFKKENEIGKLYTGDTVIECPTKGDESEYCYVYAPSLKKHGYVNSSYLRYKEAYKGRTMYAKLETGYLALRTAKKYDKNNEIGQINTGDPVIVLDDSGSEYWTVYAPTLYKTGYVNSNYLYSSYSVRKSVPMGFTGNSNAYWFWNDNNYDILNVHMQFTNLSKTDVVKSFKVFAYAEDYNHNKIYGEDTVYTITTYRTVMPGETVYCDYIALPKRTKISYLYAGVKSATLSDGTICELDYVPEQNFRCWQVK